MTNERIASMAEQIADNFWLATASGVNADMYTLLALCSDRSALWTLAGEMMRSRDDKQTALRIFAEKVRELG